MRKIIRLFIITVSMVLATYGVAAAFTSPYPASFTNWTVGNTITSAWLNAIEQRAGIGSTSTPAIDVINGISTSSVNLTASGTGLSVASSGNTITYTISSSSYLQPSKNLSELSSTSSARTNLGLGDSATLASSTWYKVANNLSEIPSTSTARSNIGLGSVLNSSQLTQGNNLSDLANTSTARTNIGFTGQANQIAISSTGTIGFASTSVSQFVNDAGYATSGSALAAGSAGNVQYNSSGILAATSTFNFATTTRTLSVTNLSISGSSTFNGTTTFPTLATSSLVGIDANGNLASSTGALLKLDDEQITSGASAFTTITLATKGYLRIVVMLQAQGSSNSNLNVQFNADTGSHYAWRASTNFAATTNGVSQTSIQNGAAILNGASSITVMDIDNFSTVAKVLSGSVYTDASAITTAPQIAHFAGMWNGTTSITTVTIGAGGGNNFITGDRIIVYGN